MRKALQTTTFRFMALALIATLILSNPALALRTEARPEAKSGLEELEQALSSLSSSFGIPILKAGLEEPGLPKRPRDFGTGDWGIITIGGMESYTLQPEDRILPNVTYESSPPLRIPIDYQNLRSGSRIGVRKIQTFPIPLEALSRFALGELTFQIVPFGTGDDRPQEDSSEGGVAVAPMAQRYLLQVWLNEQWVDLDPIPLDDGVPIVIGREKLPETMNSLLQIDLEGKVGRPVNDDRYADLFEGWFFGERDRLIDRALPEWRISISWRENELERTLYLPRQALNTRQTSRGDTRTDPRPGWNVANRKYVPEYLQAGHLHLEIMGDEAVFSDLGSTNSTAVEARSDWLATQQARIQEGRIEQDLFSETNAIVAETRGAPRPEEEPEDVPLDWIEAMERRLGDNLIVVGRLEGEGAQLNPEKAARFPFEEPFEVSLRVEGVLRAVEQFMVQSKKLYHRKSSAESWKPAYNNAHWSEEWVLVPGQSRLGDIGSKLPEGYRVRYIANLNAVFVFNHSPYQVRVIPLSAAGLEEPQTGFRKLMKDEVWRGDLERRGFAALDVEQMPLFGFQADAAFIVPDEAPISANGYQIYSDSRLTHPHRNLLPWHASGVGAQEVVQHARQKGAKARDLLLIPPDGGVSIGQVETLLREAGYASDLSDAPRVVIAGQVQVKETALSTLWFLASHAELPRVVILNVGMKLTDEAGNSYTLIVMA